MSFPFEYDHGAPLAFGGALPEPPLLRRLAASSFCRCPSIAPRPTSPGTRNGPREILQASSHMELWDEEIGADVHPVGIFTLPEMELPFGELEPLMDEIQRVAAEILARDKFLVALGGEHSITPPLVAAAAAKYPRRVTCCRSTRTPICATATWARAHNHACAMRRSARARAGHPGRHPQHVDRGSGGRPADAADDAFSTTSTCAQDPDWIDDGRRVARRPGLHHHRRRRHGSGDHAGDRHARARRACPGTRCSRCCAPSSSAGTSSPATSSS